MPALIHLIPASVEVDFMWRLLIAALLGMVLGLERSLSGKHAGMRTYALVALGSALFTVVGTLASEQLASFGGINPIQIAASVVLGIGFIGSGLAIVRSDRPVELTTASGIWVVSSIGMACGFGLNIIATTGTLLALIIFSVFSRVEHALRVRYGVTLEERG